MTQHCTMRSSQPAKSAVLTKTIPQFAAILESVEFSADIQKIWNKFCADNGYVAEHDWHKIMAAVKGAEKRLELQRELIKHSHEMER